MRTDTYLDSLYIGILFFPTGTKWEVNTTNLEKNLDSLPPATNISVRVKAFNNVGYSPSNKPVFCVTEDDSKFSLSSFFHQILARR